MRAISVRRLHQLSCVAMTGLVCVGTVSAAPFYVDGPVVPRAYVAPGSAPVMMAPAASTAYVVPAPQTVYVPARIVSVAPSPVVIHHPAVVSASPVYSSFPMTVSNSYAWGAPRTPGPVARMFGARTAWAPTAPAWGSYPMSAPGAVAWQPAPIYASPSFTPTVVYGSAEQRTAFAGSEWQTIAPKGTLQADRLGGFRAAEAHDADHQSGPGVRRTTTAPPIPSAAAVGTRK